MNYHHLLYFWTVARTGSIAAASRELRLSQPTISAQLKALEASLGQPLFERRGRGRVLTEDGRTVFRYADEIFRLGRELQLAMAGRAVGQRLRFAVGLVDVVPKIVAERLLEPAFVTGAELALEVREGPLPELLAKLALHELDLVVSDAPAPQAAHVKVFSHLLGETGVAFLATEPLRRKLKRGFPASLHGAPALLPARGTHLRGGLDEWFAARNLQPLVVAEFEDSALAKVFGQRGHGFCVAPAAIAGQVARQYDMGVVGTTDEVKERFFAISVERRIRHPGAVAIAEAARGTLFAR
ncbi:MAG: LysR family transcriptional regulator [Myxococcaceae bacterium]|nr:LysR family transcriptional regulator [Myxococcaceae bacterium]